MKKHWAIVSFVIFISIFIVLSDSCQTKMKEDESELYQTAKRYYDEAFRMLVNDSLAEAFPILIETVRTLERLPEDMSHEDMKLVSDTYYKMAQVLFDKGDAINLIDACETALSYQYIINDTFMIAREAAELAMIYSGIGDCESAMHYIDFVEPYLDTLSDFVEPYLKTRSAFEYVLLESELYDSSFRVHHEIIAFKHRRGFDTKNDSLSLGGLMYDSPYRHLSKQYLLKVFDIAEGDIQDVSRGIVMSLLAQIYEEENNPDSVAICKKYFVSYADAQVERSQENIIVGKQYAELKAERETKLDTLRKEKVLRKRNTLVAIAIVIIVTTILIIVKILRRDKNRFNEQKRVISSTLQQHIHTIYRNQSSNVYPNIIREFNSVYPGAFERFKQTYSELTETEQAICLLSFFSFRVKEIAIILNFRENTISKCRTNIKKKTGIVEIDNIMKQFV